jgi:hypothetical protein
MSCLCCGRWSSFVMSVSLSDSTWWWPACRPKHIVRCNNDNKKVNTQEFGCERWYFVEHCYIVRNRMQNQKIKWLNLLYNPYCVKSKKIVAFIFRILEVTCNLEVIATGSSWMSILIYQTTQCHVLDCLNVLIFTTVRTLNLISCCDTQQQ